ncbi:MAG TPA: PHP-associated domain-containing protein [Vicinamibacteria bacterium]|nr:PHP-associated domain-containing protein [Vicinamibacteria bacterium]
MSLARSEGTAAGGGHAREGVELMRCDLHVHSWYSGRAELPVLEHAGRECYSSPLEVHDRARRRGMDLVTLTDHDTIEGALSLAHLPDTFVSEEVTVRIEGGRQLHVNVFGLDERQHEALQARRRDIEALFAFLAEERLPASVNHLFSALTGARELADLRLPLGRLPLIEALSGAMPEGHNERARLLGREVGMAPVGGSDAHSLAHVARAFTTVPGARTREEFLAGLRTGLTVPSGRSGSYARLTGEVVRIFAAGYADTAREVLAGAPSARRLVASLALAPLLPFIPLVTLAVHLHERRFGAVHFRAFQEAYGWPTLPGERRPEIGAPSLGQAV